MRYQHGLFIPVLFTALLGSCKKEPVNEAPHITITSPTEGSSLTVPDTLLVTVQTSDDHGVTQVSVSLLDGNNIPVTDAVSATPVNGSSTLALPVTSEQLVGGTYKLFATATDGELTGKDVVHLTVVPVPLRLRALFTLVSSGSGTVSLYRTDSLGQTSLAANWPMDFGGAAISSAAQRLFVAGGATGGLRALSPDNLSTVWQRPNLSSIGAPWFTSVDLLADGGLYVGDDDGTLRSFNASNGTGIMNAVLPAQFRTEQAISIGDRVVTTERHYVTQEQRIGTYFKVSGAMESTQPLNLTPVRIFQRDADHMLIFGNQGGQGHVLDRNVPGAAEWEPYTWPSTIAAVEQLSGNAWLVALENGDLQRFSYNPTGSLPIGNTMVISTLAMNEVSGVVYGGADGHVLAIDPGSGTVLNDIPVAGPVLKVLPLYNR